MKQDADNRYDCPLAQGPCVPPRPTEIEVATLPGAEPDQAIRVKVAPERDGYVRLEHLAYNTKLGWYVQKSFCIDRERLGPLATALKQADCLMPRRPSKPVAGEADTPLRFPVPAIQPQPQAERRSS